MQVAGGIFIRPRRIAVARRNGRFLINMIILRQTAPEPKSFSKRLIRVILIMMTIIMVIMMIIIMLRIMMTLTAHGAI